MTVKFSKCCPDKTLTLQDSEIKSCKKKFTVKTFKDPDGNKQRFYIDSGKDAVIIFCLTEDEKVVLVKQYRPGPEKVFLECPGGGLEPGENLVPAASRELEEETGYRGNMAYLGSFYFSSYGSNLKHLFVATGCKKVSSLKLDREEFLETFLIPLTEYCKLLFSGSIKDVDISCMALNKIGKLKIDF